MNPNSIDFEIVFCELDERHLPSLMKLYEQFGTHIDTIKFDYSVMLIVKKPINSMRA